MAPSHNNVLVVLCTRLYFSLIPTSSTQENLHDRLLSVKKNAFLEDFLTRGTSHHPDNLAMFDLLWKFYKKNNNYMAAAKILAKLAERHGRDVDLKARIEYLSRAIVCIKSEETGILDSHRNR